MRPLLDGFLKQHQPSADSPPYHWLIDQVLKRLMIDVAYKWCCFSIVSGHTPMPAPLVPSLR
uniref:Uncharacterized protein n=1 Tax=Picea glauca TaxID=3330 RepID=A0A101M2A7_PICGL|nr:hypothetical protein ABT39_MTgene2890 [Picea glauca]QHR87578.1 hypothetical protein Q903MT_gene1589 [Picea sitchensis]